MKRWIEKERRMLWYMVCFVFLMLIDQRRGSAVGEVQMAFANCTGIVIAAVLLPSLELNDFRNIIYRVWTPICLVLAIVSICLYSFLMQGGVIAGIYIGQWVTGVLNVVVWSYLIIYMLRNYKALDIKGRMKQPKFILLVIMLVLMQTAIYDVLLPIWLLLVFGGFYLIGISIEQRKYFFSGMINGIITAFFLMQIWAFGFRPYDNVRYRGAYSGETQNGLFYLIVFCAFFLKWVWLKEKKKKIQSVICFCLLAGCVAFTLLAGGRSPLVGEFLVTLFLLIYYYIVRKKTFYGMMKFGIALIISICLLLPVVYSCVRYFPAILHHPIWYEGEYSETKSVRSFDPWNSERYISFDKMLQKNLGRILSALGIKLNLSIRVGAAELPEKGSSAENPLYEDKVYPGAFEIRISLYKYFIEHLNVRGHNRGEGVYLKSDQFQGHPHNMFIQQAYNYGIFSGIIFLGLYLYSTWNAIWKFRTENIVAGTFLVAILGFGMFEMVMIQGQLSLTLIYIFICLNYKESKLAIK